MFDRKYGPGKPVRATRLLALVIGSALLLTGCGSSQPGGAAMAAGASGEPQSGGIFTVGVQGDAGNLDPARCGTGDWLACSSIYGTLLTYDSAKQEFEPGMAE